MAETANLKRRSTPEYFPEELRKLDRWVLYRLEPHPDDPGGKPTKIPYQTTGAKASTTDPTTWTAYEEVLAHQADYSGIGFVFVEQDGFFFMDLDNCVNAETVAIADWAEGVIDQVPTYAELSQSRTGLHLVGRGTLPPEGRRKGSLEMYTTARFAVVTGWRIGGPENAESCDLLPIHKKMMDGAYDFGTGKTAAAPNLVTAPTNSLALIDKLSYLQAGRWEEAGYVSRSHADMGMCAYLSQSLSTYEEIDAAFRRSKLFRPKWDSRRGDSTYGRNTINKVLASRQAMPAPAPTALVQCPADIPDPRSLVSQPVRCVVSELLPENQVTLIAGEAGAGKTYLLMMLARALKRGEPFLGRDTIRSKTVVFLDRENPLPVIRERMFNLYGDEEECHHHWGLWVPGDEPPLLDSSRYQQFAAPGVVMIFDSLARFHLCDENSPTEMMRVFAHLRKLQALGATVIVIHHRDKKLESGYRGTAEIACGVDCLFSFSREKDSDLRVLKLLKSRVALDEQVVFRVDWSAPSVTPTESTLVAKRREHRLLISQLLRGHPEGVQQSAVIQQLGQQGVSRSQVQRYLDDGAGRFWHSTGGGRGGVPRLYFERVGRIVLR